MISNLPENVTIVIHRDEVDYVPMGAPDDKILTQLLDLCQGGACVFHAALRRSGKPQTKGDA